MMPSISNELRKLRDEGRRITFGPFRLHNTARDRIIADWIDDAIARKVDLSELVKDFLYQEATGRKNELQLIREQLEEMNLKLKNGAIMNGNGEQVGKVDDASGVLNALLGMED
jgi:hypothetical protein